MKSPRVALINPGKNDLFGMQEPLHVGFIAAYLEQHGVEVSIVDELAGADVRVEIEKIRPDLVGITATTPVAPEAYEHARFCRSLGIKTVMGGVHPSVMPQEALAYADVVVQGEGERAMLEILRGISRGRILRYPYQKDLDAVPRPAYHLMNMAFYLRAKDRVPYSTSLFFVKPRARVASLITSRGCPFSCIFCHNSWKGMPFRENSAERVLEDIRYLRDTYGIDSLFFCDDNFFADRIRLKKICTSMRNQGIKLNWGCNARADSLTPESVRLVKEAGCRQLTFGFESGSQKILDVLDKHSSLEQNRRAIALCKEAGLLSVSTFMVGNPHETVEDIELTRKFILESSLDCAGVGVTTPYPGTGLWEWCRENKYIPQDLKWSDFVADVCPIRVSEFVSPGEAKQYRSRIYFEMARQPKHFLALSKLTLLHPSLGIRKARLALRNLFAGRQQ